MDQAYLRHCDELFHYNVKGTNWYVHKYGNWERHAKYANGQPNPETAGIKAPRNVRKKDIAQKINDGARNDIIGSSNKTDKADTKSKNNKRRVLTEEEREELRQKNNKNHLISNLVQIGVGIATLNPLLIGEGAYYIAKGPAAQKAENENEERIKKLKVDKKTGLHLKDGEMSRDEDMKKVNPGFYNFDSNTKNNCMLCTTAYDLRRRGYDVAANKVSLGYEAKDIKRWYPKAKIQEIGNAYDIINNEDTSKLKKAGQRLSLIYGIKSPIRDRTIETIKKQGEGARGNLMIQFTDNWGGHSVAYEVEDGQVVIRDCQVGRKARKPDAYLDQCFKATVVRLDNVAFNPNTIKTAVH